MVGNCYRSDSDVAVIDNLAKADTQSTGYKQFFTSTTFVYTCAVCLQKLRLYENGYTHAHVHKSYL